MGPKLRSEIVLVPTEKLIPYDNNAKTHPQEQVEKIAAQILLAGWDQPIVIDESYVIIKGHGRRLAALYLQLPQVPCIISDVPANIAMASRLGDNKSAESPWDEVALAAEMKKIEQEYGAELLAATAFSQSEIDEIYKRAMAGIEAPPPEEKESKKLSDTFLVPPFSVLDARQGYWQERKRLWLALGIQSEVGRGENLLGMSETMLEPDPEKRKSLGARAANLDIESGHPYRREKQKAVAFTGAYDPNKGKAKAHHINDWVADKMESGEIETSGGLNSQTPGGGTSIFDPVLCELAYRWFCPKDGTVLDPFAGGSVRGIVASKLGRMYMGCDLRQEQVDANRAQAEAICKDGIPPVWHCGDSKEIKNHFEGHEADFIFSCPPYMDLEVYSDHSKDLSNLSDQDFYEAYREIILRSCEMLKQDRFACFVVGEVREKNRNGFYRNFVQQTIQAFQFAGLNFYNEMILVTSVGTLALRAGRTFTASRKIGKSHQNVLVFCKGDPWKAVEACGEIDIALPVEMVLPEDVEDDIGGEI